MKITKEERARIVERYRAGENATQLGDLYGISASYVRRLGARPGVRGLACVSPERRSEISAVGGKRAHELGKAHEFTPEEAREAGRKGGLAVSRDREHMARIGREGGRKSGGRKK